MLNIGLSLILWTVGFLSSAYTIVVVSLNPSDGMSFDVSCLGILWSLFKGLGSPVEDKQLIEVSNGRLYISYN
jgi:hypothetical protein